jgi:hypothetical protein
MSDVKARYLGGSPIVMPHLEGGLGPHAGESYVTRADGEREFRPIDEDIAEGEEVVIVDAGALVVTGDVITLDRESAEGRADFELVGGKPKAAKAEKE